MQSATPRVLLPLVWPLPVSLAATSGISVDFSSSAYLDVSVQRVYLNMTILFIILYQSIALMGFPIRKSTARWIFAPPRGLSQLVTSFFGSWCQGIRRMLFLAWPYKSVSFCFIIRHSSAKRSLVLLEFFIMWVSLVKFLDTNVFSTLLVTLFYLKKP